MTPLGLHYASQALDHWKKWRPKMVAEFRKEGILNEMAQKAGEQAAGQVARLMESGLQKHEAEEFVLREIILLPPET